MKYITFWKNDEAKGILRSWWKNLSEQRGDRAELRRAKNVGDVLLCVGFHRLLNQYKKEGYIVDGRRGERLSIVAGVLSHVKENDESNSFAKQMALPTKGGGPSVSGLRFRRLLNQNDDDALYRDLIRSVQLLRNRANIVSLADAAYRWDDEIRKQWAFEYYAIAPDEK